MQQTGPANYAKQNRFSADGQRKSFHRAQMARCPNTTFDVSVATHCTTFASEAMVHSTHIYGADAASDLNDLSGSEAGSAPELSTATLSSGARTRYLIQISRLSGHAASESRS
jgi:hypothetical protein